MSETLIRRVLYFIGAWNVFGGGSALADPTGHFVQMYSSALNLEDPLQVFFYRATWINVIAWGLGYSLAAHYSGARVPILLAGALGKLTYSGACLTLFYSGIGRTLLFAAGILDAVFAIFFVYVIWLGENAPLASAQRV